MTDLRYAIRQLAKNPTFSVIAILTLGLGIGVNVAIFSAAEQTFRPDIPFADPDRLVRVYQIPESGSPNLSPRVPVFLEVRDQTDVFESVAASRFTDLSLTTDQGPQRVVGNAITPGWLATLGIQPAIGRAFTAEEEAIGTGSRVVVVAYSTWQGRFGGENDIVGRTIRLNGEPHTVVGVMPRGFTYPYEAEFWMPFRPEDDTGEAFWALNIKARLRPDATLAMARDEMRRISEQIGGQVSGLTAGMTITPIPVREVLVDNQAGTVTILTIAVGFLLLVVCANLANLMLSRALTRDTEFALRSSLGASRHRLLRQSLTESAVLGAAGGGAGVVIAWMTLSFLEPLVPSRLVTIGAELSLNGAALGFAIGLSIATGLLVGVVPAWRLSSTSPSATLRLGARTVSRGHRGLGGTLVVVELAVTLVLLTGVGLMVRDLQRRQAFDLGYEQRSLAVFSVALDREPYMSGEQRAQFIERFVDELQASPMITAAGATTMFPRHRGNVLSQVEAEGQVLDADADGLTVNSRFVTPTYLRGLGASLVQGRWLTELDREGSEPVVVVSQSFAERLWPNQDPVGQRVRDRRAGTEAPWHTVVGVVRDVRESDEISYSWYRPYAQNADSRGAAQLTIWARASLGTGAPMIRTIRGALDLIDGALPIFEATTAQMLNNDALARERQGALLGIAFALFGLILAALGVYGSISYSVSRRMREFGIRMALGSDRQRILRQVLSRVGIMVAVGGVAGLVGAIAIARVIGSQLVETGPFDLMAFTVAIGLLSIAGFAAGAFPAWRATRVDPAEALRAD